jgi:hypothetical protein
MKPADRSDFVALTPRDFDAFYKFLLENPKKLPDTDLNLIDNATTKMQATKDMERVRQTFSRDQLIAGVEILKALSETFELDNQEKQIVFARNAYIGWILARLHRRKRIAPQMIHGWRGSCRQLEVARDQC